MNRKEEYQDERWKERAAEIRALDHHQCVMCGAKDVELHVHHLSYPPPPFHIWEAYDTELVTLCKDCHAKIHQSTKRPKFNESRELFDIETGTKQGDCSRCKYCVQEHMLDSSEKFMLDYYGICIEHGGDECHFVETTKCKYCVYLEMCIRKHGYLTVNEKSDACSEYRRRTCLECKHFHLTGEDSFDGSCLVTGDNAWAGDQFDECSCKGEYFECVAETKEGLKEYWKQFD